MSGLIIEEWPVLVLTPALERAIGLGLRLYEEKCRQDGVPVLSAVSELAAWCRERAQLAKVPARPSAPPEMSRNEPGNGETVSYMTSRAAADTLKMTDRRVRQLCESGELLATRADDGAWRIRPADLADLAAIREGA